MKFFYLYSCWFDLIKSTNRVSYWACFCFVLTSLKDHLKNIFRNVRIIYFSLLKISLCAKCQRIIRYIFSNIYYTLYINKRVSCKINYIYLSDFHVMRIYCVCLRALSKWICLNIYKIFVEKCRSNIKDNLYFNVLI